ncbi:MAG TPA: RNA 3'-terminal phosphate cyclase [Pyrinomonadaceae bacterium]|jgi:RNA 3'-terminal phosphate cyclase (ATP)
MITIDGSYGEGGGQIIRTSLALSLVTGKPFRIERVRARRSKPGLQRQHLTAVTSAAEIGRAELSGATVGSTQFTFAPREVVPGDYTFSIGTAGSTTLVLQTVLPPLMIAASPSRLTLEGGTHNVHAPPFEFIAETFLPLINRMGPQVWIELRRYGFYPPGGGRFTVSIEPAPRLTRLDIAERGPIRAQRARALVVNLPAQIGYRELAVVKEKLGLGDDQMEVETSTNAFSPGNVLTIHVASEHLTEVVTGMGERGVRAETVAAGAAQEALDYLESGASVGQHLADQLLVPLALAGGGSFLTMQPSLHTTTNIAVIKNFLDTTITVEQVSERLFRIEVKKR